MCAFWKQSLWAPLQRSQHAQWKFNQILQVLCKVLPSLLQDSSAYCNCHFACEAQRSVEHRAAEGKAQGHAADSGSKILPLVSKTQLNLPNSIDQSRKHYPNHDTGVASMLLYSMPLYFIKDVSMKWSVLQYRAYVVCIFATHLYVRRREILNCPGKSLGMKK